MPFADATFDLALCSHFLFLYSAHFDLDFHRQAILELLRVAREVCIFPCSISIAHALPTSNPSARILRSAGYDVELVVVPYEFQRGGNEMLRVSQR